MMPASALVYALLDEDRRRTLNRLYAKRTARQTRGDRSSAPRRVEEAP
jgi:hypothetical protein